MLLFDTIATTPDANAQATLQLLLKGLGAKVTRATVQKSLERHPDFPSLLSLSDVLTDWHIDSMGMQLNTAEQLRELPLPFVAHLRKRGGWYVQVKALMGNTITYTDSATGQHTESLADFEQKWTGVVLLAETNDDSGEPAYAAHRRQEVLENLRAPFVWIGSLLVTLITLLPTAQHLIPADWFLLLTRTIGLMLSSLLVAKQLGSTNALTDRLCRINSKTSCDGVLNSPAAKLWGWLSWADVGLLYFAGGLFMLLLVGVSSDLRPLLYGLALLALPYTVFSVYYQARVVRQWCTLCLGVQGVLLAEGMVAITQPIILPTVWQPYFALAGVFLVPILLWVIIKPLMLITIKSRQEHDELMRLKRNPDLFRALLLQQPQMPPVPNDLHPIVLGNPEAGHTITMVTNPYCGSCAQTHSELERLLAQNQDVKANVIFTGGSANSPALNMAIHTLALTEANKAPALTDWYQQGEKNFDAWAQKYPHVSDTTKGQAMAHRHSEWCRLADIDFTPTLFVDGYLLPEQYRLDGLRWLVNELPIQFSMMDLAKS